MAPPQRRRHTEGEQALGAMKWIPPLATRRDALASVGAWAPPLVSARIDNPRVQHGPICPTGGKGQGTRAPRPPRPRTSTTTTARDFANNKNKK